MTESDRPSGHRRPVHEAPGTTAEPMGAAGTTHATANHDSDAAIASVEQEFSALFVQLRIRMRAQALALHPQLQPFGYLMIGVLARKGPLHAGALAEELDSDKSLISRQASHLEAVGMLRREPDTLDRRSTYFALTDDARRRWDAQAERMRRELHEGLADWGVDDLTLFASLLRRLNEL